MEFHFIGKTALWGKLNLYNFDELDIIYIIGVVDFYETFKEKLKNHIINQGIVIFER